jgi:hypothetical protein
VKKALKKLIDQAVGHGFSIKDWKRFHGQKYSFAGNTADDLVKYLSANAQYIPALLDDPGFRQCCSRSSIKPEEIK